MQSVNGFVGPPHRPERFVPRSFRSPKKVSARMRAVRPIWSLSSLQVASKAIFSAKAALSFGGTMNPLELSITASAAPPHDVATTGLPGAMASDRPGKCFATNGGQDENIAGLPEARYIALMAMNRILSRIQDGSSLQAFLMVGPVLYLSGKHDSRMWDPITQAATASISCRWPFCGSTLPVWTTMVRRP